MEELEFVGLKLVQEMRLLNERAHILQDKGDELTKSLASSTSEVANLKCELASAKEQAATSRAQLLVRTEATRHLEKDNAQFRDTVAKLKVQLESVNAARQQLTDKCQLLETELLMWKSKSEQMERTWKETESLKTQTYYQQNHIKSLLQQSSTQLELLEKDHSRLERSVQEVRSFNQQVVKNSQTQSILLDRAIKANNVLETQLANISATLISVEKERDELSAAKNGNNTCNHDHSYLTQWEKYQDTMKKRMEGLMEQNEKLVQEVKAARNLSNNQ